MLLLQLGRGLAEKRLHVGRGVLELVLVSDEGVRQSAVGVRSAGVPVFTGERFVARIK